VSDLPQDTPNPDDNRHLQSPLRPTRPEPESQPEFDKDPTGELSRRWATEPNTPSERMVYLREKMEEVANEYADDRISRAQFNAIYAHYSEQRQIIEQIIARNPKNQGWKQAARSGKTQFLRQHFEAQAMNYVVYAHKQKRPVMGGGTRPNMQRISSLLRTLWSTEKVRVGVARISLGGSEWLIMAAGYYSVTFVTFHLEPSGEQVRHIRDLHNDFERANRLYLQRGKTNKLQMVFPQRALLEDE
jgi:hypothetical protein